MRDALKSEFSVLLFLGYVHTVQSKELDECAPEQLTHLSGRGEMVSPWSVTPHLNTRCKTCNESACARISDICNTALGWVRMLWIYTFCIKPWPIPAWLGLQMLRIWFVLALISLLISCTHGTLLALTDLRVRPGLSSSLHPSTYEQKIIRLFELMVFLFSNNTVYEPKRFCLRSFLLSSLDVVSTRSDPSRNLEAFFSGPTIWSSGFWI
jgi:hypothetical protein